MKTQFWITIQINSFFRIGTLESRNDQIENFNDLFDLNNPGAESLYRIHEFDGPQNDKINDKCDFNQNRIADCQTDY